ncbi:MAG: hypothetical protein L3K15_04095 [Thermoplasmata archaeon]|nr:hypothetical protein [Thermoplasmata archaeon]
MTDLNQVIQTLLFAIFAGLTAVLAAIIGPTYDNLLVPELAPSALYPSFPASGGGAGSFLARAGDFSGFLVVHLVDPALGLVAVGVGVLYLARATSARLTDRTQAMLPRLVVAALLANFTLPVAGAIFAIAGATYPVIEGYDHGSWQHWVNLAGFGAFSFSWDNGVLAFVVSFLLFSLVLLLTAAVALRDAMLAVLVVLLPVATLLWPLPTFAPLARRAWLLFVELAFLPCVVVVPLELAVGAPNILLLLGYLTVAVSAPSLISLAGAPLREAGFPSGGAGLVGGLQRGLLLGSSGSGGYLRPLAAGGRAGRAGPIAGSLARTATAITLPASIPALSAEAIGWGAHQLIHHLPKAIRAARGRDRFPPVRAANGLAVSGAGEP